MVEIGVDMNLTQLDFFVQVGKQLLKQFKTIGSKLVQTRQM